MEFIENLFLGLLGLASGLTVAGGVFTTLIVVGLIPRFAGKTHTAKHIFWYEEMVVFGTVLGAVISVFLPFLLLPEWFAGSERLQILYRSLQPVLLGTFGLFAGIFVGCLALAIAEMLDSIPIFARRAKFRHGVGITILVMAIGKMGGSLLYFMNRMFS